MNTVIVYGMNNVAGGIENYLLNLYNNIHNDIKFVYFVENVSNLNNFIYKKDIDQFSGEYRFLPDHHKLKEFMTEFRKLLREYKRESNTVYLNFNNIAFDIIPIRLALSERYRVITHSHNAMQEPIKNLKYRIRNKILRSIAILWLSELKVERLAVSQSAGDYLYNGKPFKIVPPGIDVERFAYNEEMRIKIRSECKLNDSVVLGFVGRIVAVKNPLFLVDILSEAKKRISNVKLMVVGDGIMKEEMIDKAKECNVTDDIIFIGSVKNVQDYLQGMDVLLAPSFSEGMSLVVIEAQSTGLPCICAKGNIPEAVNVTGEVCFCNLKAGAGKWATAIQEIIKQRIDRTAMNEIVLQSEVNVANASKKILEIIR